MTKCCNFTAVVIYHYVQAKPFTLTLLVNIQYCMTKDNSQCAAFDNIQKYHSTIYHTIIMMIIFMKLQLYWQWVSIHKEIGEYFQQIVINICNITTNSSLLVFVEPSVQKYICYLQQEVYKLFSWYLFWYQTLSQYYYFTFDSSILSINL